MDTILQASISSISFGDITSFALAFILGLLVGVLVKRALQFALIVIAIIAILVFMGAISPATIEHWLMTLSQQASSMQSAVYSYFNLLPYNSVAFIIGLAIGLWKG